ncbi:MAG: HAD-IIIA family hydrolase [Pseudomonadota bacterium]|nr:HAD-IIIA family hydrolase [Pseudomonadota bacterium]
MKIVEKANLWVDIRAPVPADKRSALFLDRDGTLIELVDYLSDPSAVKLIADTVLEVRKANEAGEAVVIVTNQSGVGRGYYDWKALQDVQARLYDLLSSVAATVDATYACPHPPPDAGGPEHSRYRKPAPGMLIRASEDLNLDLARSRIIGDSVSDLAAGKAAGLASGTLVSWGHGIRDWEAARLLADDKFTVNR